MRKFSDAYKTDFGNYNARADTFGPTIGGDGWNRCRPPALLPNTNYPFGYPTHIGASPQYRESYLPELIKVQVPSPIVPANVRLSMEDPDNPLSYLNLIVNYAPRTNEEIEKGLICSNNTMPMGYLNPKTTPCTNPACGL